MQNELKYIQERINSFKGTILKTLLKNVKHIVSCLIVACICLFSNKGLAAEKRIQLNSFQQSLLSDLQKIHIPFSEHKVLYHSINIKDFDSHLTTQIERTQFAEKSVKKGSDQFWNSKSIAMQPLSGSGLLVYSEPISGLGNSTIAISIKKSGYYYLDLSKFEKNISDKTIEQFKINYPELSQNYSSEIDLFSKGTLESGLFYQLSIHHDEIFGKLKTDIQKVFFDLKIVGYHFYGGFQNTNFAIAACYNKTYSLLSSSFILFQPKNLRIFDAEILKRNLHITGTQFEQDAYFKKVDDLDKIKNYLRINGQSQRNSEFNSELLNTSSDVDLTENEIKQFAYTVMGCN